MHLFRLEKKLKCYLIYEQKCFTRYKTRGAAERFISDKARIASIFNGFKNDPFYTHFVSEFAKEFRICRENRGKRFVKIHVCFYHV